MGDAWVFRAAVEEGGDGLELVALSDELDLDGERLVLDERDQPEVLVDRLVRAARDVDEAGAADGVEASPLAAPR